MILTFAETRERAKLASEPLRFLLDQGAKA